MLPSPTSVAELVLRSADETVSYVAFWGHQPPADGSLGAGCLSQWWPAPVRLDGHAFPTAEHVMMWRKARVCGDETAARLILSTPAPETAKALGRGVTPYVREAWERERFAAVVAANLAKFGQHDDLRAYLLGTGDAVLVEASPVDLVWGVGLAEDDPGLRDPARWRGQNLLGFALMQVRTTLST